MVIFYSMNKKYINAIEWVKEYSYGMRNRLLLSVLRAGFKDKRIVWHGEDGYGIAVHSS